MSRSKAIGVMLLYMLMYFGVQSIVTGIYGAIIGIRTAIQYSARGYELDVLEMVEVTMQLALEHTGYILIISAILTFLLFWLIHRVQERHFNITNTWNILPMHWQHAGLLVLFGAATGMTLSFFLNLISQMQSLQSTFDKYESFTIELLSGHVLLLFLAVGIIAPIIEEVLFRGIILKYLLRSFSIRSAVIIQAVAFGIYHFNLVQSTYAILLGVLLGYVALKFRTIIASIAVHIGINSLAVITMLDGTVRVLESFGLVILLLAIACVCYVMWWMMKYLLPIPNTLGAGQRTVLEPQVNGGETFEFSRQYHHPNIHEDNNGVDGSVYSSTDHQRYQSAEHHGSADHQQFRRSGQVGDSTDHSQFHRSEQVGDSSDHPQFERSEHGGGSSDHSQTEAHGEGQGTSDADHGSADHSQSDRSNNNTD